MKKLMFSLFVTIGLAGAVSASQFDWKFTASTSYVGYNVYVVLASEWPSAISSADALTGAASSSAKIATAGRSTYASETAISTTEKAFSDGSVSFYYVVLSSDNSSYWQSAAQSVTAYTPTATADANTLNASTLLGTAGDAASGWVSIAPEPGSIGLLMLGLCALGLKRKVA